MAVKSQYRGSGNYLLVLLIIFGVGCDGLRLNKKDRDILSAAGVGDTKRVVELIESGANLNVKSFDGREMTPLLWAVSQAHWDTAVLLIEKGASVNVADKGGISVHEWAEYCKESPEAAQCIALIESRVTGSRSRTTAH